MNVRLYVCRRLSARSFHQRGWILESLVDMRLRHVTVRERLHVGGILHLGRVRLDLNGDLETA